MDALSVDTAGKAATLLERMPIAAVAVLAIAGLVLVFRRWVKDGAEHRAEISSLNAKHASELKLANEARFTLAVAFESTIRELVIAAKSRRYAKKAAALAGERKE